MKRIKTIIGKVKCRFAAVVRRAKCKLGFHAWVRADRGESGEIYVECRFCYKEAE